MRPKRICATCATRWRSTANRSAILPSFERTDVEFHHVLAVIPGNPIFEAIHAAIAEWLVEQRHDPAHARSEVRRLPGA